MEGKARDLDPTLFLTADGTKGKNAEEKCAGTRTAKHGGCSVLTTYAKKKPAVIFPETTAGAARALLQLIASDFWLAR
jgi:hypothetical protein